MDQRDIEMQVSSYNPFAVFEILKATEPRNSIRKTASRNSDFDHWSFNTPKRDRRKILLQKISIHAPIDQRTFQRA